MTSTCYHVPQSEVVGQNFSNFMFSPVNCDLSPGQTLKSTACLNIPSPGDTLKYHHSMSGKHALLVAVIIPRLLHNSLPLLISRQPVEKCVAEVTLHWLWLVMMDGRRTCQPSTAARPGKLQNICILSTDSVSLWGVESLSKESFKQIFRQKTRSQYDELHDKELLVFESEYFQLYYTTCSHVRNCSDAWGILCWFSYFKPSIASPAGSNLTSLCW